MERISCRTGMLAAPRFSPAVVFAAVVALVSTEVVERAFAQQVIPFGQRIIRADRGTAAEGESSALLPVDRETTRQWERAQKLIADGRYSDGITLLDGILQGGEDYFRPEGETPRSLKAAALKLIGDLPSEGRKSYELQFGALAQQMLNAAAENGDIPKLEEIARRFFHTQAGYDATLLLGHRELDHNRPLAAAQCFKRLADSPAAAERFEPSLSVILAICWSRSGMNDRAKDTLIALKKNYPNAKLQIAQKDVPLFAKDDQALAWLQATAGEAPQKNGGRLEDWLLARGNAERNPSAPGSLPLLNPRWRISTTNHPDLENMLVARRKSFIDSNIAAIPVMQPLAVGDVVLMRTSRNLLAVNFETGKRCWWPLLSESSLEQKLAASNSTNSNGRFDPQNNAIIERFWQDATYGTLASDGERVYLIDDLDAANDNVTNMPNGAVIMNGRIVVNGVNGGFRRGFNFDPLTAYYNSYNKLTAIELRTEGKIKWVIGGASGEDEPKLAGAFFLGPPLPLQDKLYVLAEVKQEIKLCALDAKTGKLDWSQQIAIVDQNIQYDPFRRLAGCTPSYSDGVLVCPTTAGVIVAVDIANRSLLWAYDYPSTFRFNPVLMQRQMISPPSQLDRWQDANVVIADGKVLATPFESSQLHCLNLLDGSPAWKKPVERGDDLYIGGVHAGKVLIVGKRRMTALDLNDGSNAWTKSEIELPSAAMPSGRGFLSGDLYYLPLTSAEVASIDVKEANIVGTAKSRKGTIPGNLVSFRGEIISQAPDYVETFSQLDGLEKRIAKTLAEKPDDPWALAHRGEIELDQGKLDEAIADIRRSYQADPSSFTRDLMIEALIAGLAKDFAKYRGDVADLEKLVSSDAERAAFLRVLASGLQESGNAVAALDSYLKIATLEPHSDEPEEVDANLSTARSAWVRAQFQSLLKTVKASERPKIDAAVEERLKTAIAEGGPRPLREFISYFGDHPAADKARELMLEKLVGPDTALERERLLLRLEKSSEAARKAAATAQLAAMLRELNRTEESLALYRQLKAEHGAKPVLNGKSVEQITSALPADAPLTVAAKLDASWPEGEVKIERTGSRTPRIAGVSRLFSMELRGKPGPFFRDLTVAFSQDGQQIVGYDGLGKERFRLALNDGNQVTTINNPLATYAMVQGHILIVSTGNQILGFDTLKTGPNHFLWKKDLIDAQGGIVYFQPPMIPQQFGNRRATQPNAPPVGTLGPCTDFAVYYQRGRDVYAIDPVSGNTLWVRHGIEPGSDLFGDDEVLVVAPQGKERRETGATVQAMVLRAPDGQYLSESPVPLPDQRWTTFGRMLLVTRTTPDGNLLLAMLDPSRKREVWTVRVANGMKGAVVDGESIAVMQPDGKFSLVSLADGTRTIDEQLEPDRNLQNIYYLRSADCDILVTNHPQGMPRPNANLNQQFYSPDISRPEIHGCIYAFDRTRGTRIWPGPVRVAGQCLALDAPSELPVLVFTRTIAKVNNNRVTSPTGSVLCIDKRNGRLLFEDEALPQVANTLEVYGDPANKTVSLQVPGQAFTLKFTEKPVPPEPPYQSDTFEKQAGSKTTAMLRTLGEVFAPMLQPNNPLLPK
jgi:outer membrane protein assembly factor BamB